MKTRILPAARLSFPLACALAALLAVSSATAATYYWDQNGTTAGFGSATGTWTNPTVSRWSTSNAGTATPGTSVTTAIGDPLHFGTDSVALGTGSITVTGTVNAASLRFGSSTTGNVTLSGGTINLADTTSIHVGAGSTTVHTISSQITGAATSLTKTGNTLQLSGSNTFTGQTTISAGTLILNNATALGGNSPGVNGTLSVTMASGTSLQSNFAPADQGNSNSFVYAPITLTGTGTANFRIGAGNSTAPAEAVTFNLNGAIGGVAGANVVFGNTTGDRNNANSEFVLGAASTYNGNTTIEAGNANNRINVKAGAANALPSTTVLSFESIAGGGTGRLSQFDLNGNNQTLAGLSNGGTVPNLRNHRVTNSGALATLTINNAGNFTFGGKTVSTSTTNGQITGTLALIKSGSGTFTLTGNNTYSGATEVTDGTLVLSASGDNVGSINSTSGITINGGTAKFRQDSTTAVSPTVTLTQGTLTGNGTVNTVNVGANTGGIISNNNGVAGAALTVGTLNFNGAATVNIFSSGTSAPVVTTSLATNAAGVVTINPSAPIWAAGIHDLISYGGGSIGGAGFSQFTLGTVAGISPRQSMAFGDSGTAITLTVGADNPPFWAGDGDGKWNLGSTNNWKFISDSSSTTFLAGDNVLFNDNATGAGPVAVNIDTANVAPTSTTFNNPTKDYVLSGAFGISSGSLTKSGSGGLTITNANSYTGNTTINGGVLDISTDGAQLYSGANPVTAVVTVGSGAVLVVRNLGQANTSGVGSPSLGNLNNSGSQVVIDGGTLRFNNETASRGRVINVGSNGATLDVVNNSTYIWTTSPGTSVPFSGSGQTLTLTGDGTSTGQINLVIGGTNVSLVKNGAATWTLGGTNTYTGNTTITAGTLSMAGNKITGSPTISIGNGATLQSTAAFTFAAGQDIIGTGTTGFVTMNPAGSNGFVTTSGTDISTSGTLTFSRLDVRGTGNVISSGAIQSGGAANNQRGLLVGNTATGDLTLNSGASLTTGAAGANSQDLLGNGTATGTFIINGGTYTNAAGLATLQLGNAASNGSGILTLTSGSASIGTIAYQAGTGDGIVNLDGGTLTLGNIIDSSGASRIFNFNGGQFIAGAGVTFPANVTANVKNGGALFDTNGFSATIASSMVNFAGTSTGGLTKSGLGTLTLSGVNTYAGGTSVTQGTLRFSTAAASATVVTVAGGAEAGALVAANDGQWVNTGNLTLQNNGAALVDYGSTTPTTNASFAPIKVTNFTNGTTPGVKLAGGTISSLAVSQTYPLVTWTGTGPVDGSAFDLRTHRLAGTFSVSSNTLFLTVTSNATGAPVSWNTGNGAWDTSTVNWVASNLATTTYFDSLDSVLFGDATGASGNPTITLATTVSPLGVTMNSTGHDYTVSGAGSIGGSGALTLAAANTRTLTLSTASNSFSGGTTINGGTLALGAATNTLSDTGAVTVDGATAVLSLGTNSDTVGAVTLRNGATITGSGGTLTGASYALESGSVPANLGGSGALTKSTTGTVTLSGNNTLTGTTTVSGGTLVLLGDNSAGTGATNISGGTVVAAHVNALNTTGSVGISTASATGTLRLATDTSVAAFPLGASSNFPGTIISDRATSGAGITHVLGAAIVGNNIWTIEAGTNVTSGTAAVSIASVNLSAGNAGTCTFNPTTASLLIPGPVNIGSNSDLKTLGLSGASTGNEVSGIISNGINTLSVTKSGTSTWTLSGANNYTGTTTIDQGTLAFTTTDPSLTGGLTFGSANGGTNNGTLDLSTASATFAGAALVRTNSVVANAINIGATKQLTLNGNLTLGYDAAGGTAQTDSMLTVTGSGSMAVNGTTIAISANQAAQNAGYWSKGTLDVSGLAAFSTNVTNFNIGVGGTTQGPGTVLLSDTANTIIATTLTAGNTGANNGRGTGLLVLGTGTNLIQADTINIGLGKNAAGGTGVVWFASQTAGSPGTVSITDKAGTGLANITVGDNGTANNTGGGAIGTLDLRGHIATVNAGTLKIGINSITGSNGGVTGTVSFDAGTFNVNTLTMAAKDDTNTGAANATLNVGGGSFTVNTAFTLGSQTGSGSANGTLNITGGTFTSNAEIVDGGGTATSTITLNGGTLDMTGKNIGGVTPFDNLNFQSGTLQNLGEVNNGAGWTKSTSGTLILAGTNTYTGAATVNAGTLSLTGTLNPISTLAVGGGTLSYDSAAAQSVSGLTVNAGSSTVTNTNAGATNILNLGAITHNPGGVVDFANATAGNNVIQTTTGNTNGILGPWAFVGSDWAMNDGTGNIVAYTAYTNVARRTPGTIADDSMTNVRIIEGAGSPGNIKLGAATTTVNTLLQSDSGGTSAATVDVGALETLRTGAIMMLSPAGTLTVGTTPNSGTLTAATGGGELILTNESSVNPMTINSAIADHTSASSLTKAGAGTVILSGTNTYTGATTVADGTLRLGGTLASATAVVTNGTLQAAGNLPATAAVTVSGTSVFDLFGASQTVASLTNVAGNTLTNSSPGTHASTATTPGTPALTDALTISAPVAANTMPLLITDGPTRKTQVVLNNGNGNATNIPTNTANTFSGGTVLAHNATNGTRLLLNGTNSGLVGTGPIIVGQANTDKAGVYFTAATTLANDIVFNTAIGTDRVGLRADAAVNLSGKITANLAPATFTSNSATGGNLTLTGQVTGASGLVLDITSLSAAATSFNVTLNNAGTPNNYAGDTVINLNAATGKSANLNLGAADQIPNGASTGNVVINTNGTGVGTLNLGGFSETINGLSGNGTVEGATTGTPTNTLTLGDNNATGLTFSGVIMNTAGTLSLAKTGNGIQTLSGVNTYTGATTVNGGTLLVNSPGSLAAASAVAVNNTSTLGGNGTISGSVTVTAAGNLAPGASAAGTLAVGGALDISALAGGAGTLSYELNTLAASDKIVAGTLAIGSGALGFNDFAFTNLGGLQAGTYQLITSAGLTGTLDPANLTGMIGAFKATLQLSGTGNDVELVVSSAYTSWAALKGLDGTSGKENGKGDDPDNDGKNNLYEFAFDGNPLAGANDGKIVGKLATVGGAQVLTLTLPVRTGAAFSADSGDQLSALIDGIYYRIEGDKTLSPFADNITEVTTGDETAIQAGLPALSTGWTYRTFRAPGTVATEAKAFLRAKISETP